MLAVADVVDVGFQAEEVAVLLDAFLAEFLLFQQAGLFVPQRVDAAGQVIQELPGFGVRGVLTGGVSGSVCPTSLASVSTRCTSGV